MDLAQVDLMKVLIEVLIGGLVIFIVAKVLPGIAVQNFWSAIVVALVFGILNALITWGFNYFGLTSINGLVSKGIFQVVFNAILLMLTDKVVEGFYVKNFWFALLAAFLIALLSGFAHQFLH